MAGKTLHRDAEVRFLQVTVTVEWRWINALQCPQEQSGPSSSRKLSSYEVHTIYRNLLLLHSLCEGPCHCEPGTSYTSPFLETMSLRQLPLQSIFGILIFCFTQGSFCRQHWAAHPSLRSHPTQGSWAPCRLQDSSGLSQGTDGWHRGPWQLFRNWQQEIQLERNREACVSHCGLSSSEVSSPKSMRRGRAWGVYSHWRPHRGLNPSPSHSQSMKVTAKQHTNADIDT